MASIDDVINRSREPGEFTERRQFTVARGRAIQKLREFALVDPHYYILELIQSAVANGATYIDVRCDRTSTALSYIGGSFPEAALAQLFDFLFAAESDVEQGPLRQLALGVNALMLFEPDEIIIETGDGTLPGTTRIAIREDDEMVEVGRPEQALEGTFLRATGMNRREHNRRSQLRELDGHPREYHAIENRCLVAPVPILVNHDPIFGYSSQRTPESLMGFRQTVTFDEGDLYGTIGIAQRHSGAVFRLLTHGVWIESTRHEFSTQNEGTIDNLGGVITFDRLRKTADHSAIVEDEHYQEMWLRLAPYVNQLVTGGVESDFEVRSLSGDAIEGAELIDLLRGSDTLIMAPITAIGRDDHHRAASRISDSLGLPVICVRDEHRQAVQTLGGSNVHFITPDLDDDEELTFYTQDEADIPARPWLLSPVELGTISLAELLDHIPYPQSYDAPEPSSDVPHKMSDGTPLRIVQKAVWFLGNRPRRGQMPEDWKVENLDPLEEFVRARIFTPQKSGDGGDDTNVEVRAAQRVVWTGHDESIAPGQMLLIDVADIAPPILWNPPEKGDKPAAELLARAVVDTHTGSLGAAANRGLRAALRADFEPGGNAARLVLASLTRQVVKRIRSDRDEARIVFSIVDTELPVSVLDVPILTTLAGDDVCLRDVERMMEQCHGLLYAVRSDVAAALDKFDRQKILVVDEPLERLLVSLVGPTAYVRIDDREVIAEFEGVQCRDIAVGLRHYPDFPLLVEGQDPSDWSEERQKACIEALASQLMKITSAQAGDLNAQERRRHAWRHLQWFATHHSQYPAAGQSGLKAASVLPLFGLANSRTCSYSAIDRTIEENGHIEMLDGWAVGAGELAFSEAIRRQVSSDIRLMTMNPFVLHLLGNRVRGAAEYHLSEQEVEALEEPDLATEAMLERVIIEGDASGVIGVPHEPVERPAVVVFNAEHRDVWLREDIGRVCGVVGKIRLREGIEYEDAEKRIIEASTEVLSHLLARLPRLADGNPAHYERALSVLLAYAGHRMQLIAQADRTLEVEIADGLSRQILNSPLFAGADGLPVSAMAICREFQGKAARALVAGESLDFRTTVLADDVPAALSGWIERFLRLERVHRPTCRAHRMESPQPAADDAELCVAATLEHWINALHPDTAEDAKDGHHITVEMAPPNFFAGSLTASFCQLPSYAHGDISLLRINPDHWLTRWLAQEGGQSQRPIAWAILAAYARINTRLRQVTNDHELNCQQLVAQAIAENKLKMVELS